MAAHGHPTVAAILVAAGSGERLGADVPKAFVEVAGRTLLAHVSATFLEHPRVRDVIVVAPAHLTAEARLEAPGAHVVPGGATRQQSVACGLALVPDDVDVVLVHDVARAFVPADMIDRVIQGLSLRDARAAVPIMPVTDTMRRIDPAKGDLHETVDRSTLTAVQTPQGFVRDALDDAHAHATHEATDDASLVEARGGRVVAVRGDQRAFKVTVPFDLLVAEALFARGGRLEAGKVDA